ncbi:Gtr1/RagA G protein conserved region-domain-containing protein [Lasiosphaeria hispida]|uniref:GTP-binding protein n=1 Tax=Lasiosphaeria hispida TaxID=260671 RepID=A0AAJ0HQL1_9PEZI|nr:Gtr1/RagA G protein conserved region-domain-containing protein [Lasiosphaeria hispida]
MSDLDATLGPSDGALGTGEAAAVASSRAAQAQLKKVKKQKVLLMGKSGSGKSSMRSIIFSNYLARDTRRLGATIDIDLSHVKFLGNLTLNLWDCGGQEAFMENYLSQQRAHVFSNVGVLIYVFDIESRDVERDLATYVNIISALVQYSREAKVFVLIHKMDLIQPAAREAVFDQRVAVVRRKTAEAVAIVRKQKPDLQQQQQQQQQQQLQSPQYNINQHSPYGAASAAAPLGGAIPDIDLDMQLFATSIWDQSLYKAWASIIHDLVPNLSVIETQLASLGVAIDADEILLFERTSFLVVSKWTSREGERNPYGDRFERMSNILKSWKHTCSKFTGTPRNAEQFSEFEYKMGTTFSMFVTKFTTNTYVLVCMAARRPSCSCEWVEWRAWGKRRITVSEQRRVMHLFNVLPGWMLLLWRRDIFPQTFGSGSIVFIRGW